MCVHNDPNCEPEPQRKRKASRRELRGGRGAMLEATDLRPLGSARLMNSTRCTHIRESGPRLLPPFRGNSIFGSETGSLAVRASRYL